MEHKFIHLSLHANRSSRVFVDLNCLFYCLLYQVLVLKAENGRHFLLEYCVVYLTVLSRHRELTYEPEQKEGSVAVRKSH